MRRSSLLATTILSGILGTGLLGAIAAQAQQAQPAVSMINEKAEAFGGELAGKAIFGANGTIALPFQGPFGAQIDGGLGGLDGSFYGGVGGHLFWRNPDLALLGLYASTTYYDRLGGVDATHIGPEGAYYWGPLTLEGVMGVEFGNTVSAPSSNTTVGAFTPFTTTTVTGESYDVKTRFFDELNLKGYVNEDWSALIGHRFLGGKNALALGTEYAIPIGNMMGSVFVTGDIGSHTVQGVWGGLKIYFGQDGKSLTARERQDDPENWTTDTLFSITGNHHNGSSGSRLTCNSNEVLVGNNCDDLLSDIAWKCDIALLAWLAIGVGLYRYRYKWSETVYVGVMAQEIERVMPEAVSVGADGYRRVNYRRLGLKLRTWDDWQRELGAAAVAPQAL